jgi:CubicO group peptidase (beta-lactamase class C family)
VDLFDADPEKYDLRVWHALSMSAGLEWIEGIGADEESDGHAMDNHPDSTHFVLEKPLRHEPGKRFLYNDGLPTLLAAAIENTSGMPMDSYAEQCLFSPLDIDNYEWEYQTDGMIRAGGGLHMTGRDLAKIGLFYLQDGVWNENRLIPEGWPEVSSREWISAGGNGYGFLWWLRPSSNLPGFQMPSEEIYFASGYGGQKLFVAPDYDLAVVFFGNDSWAKKDDDKVPHFIAYNILQSITD